MKAKCYHSLRRRFCHEIATKQRRTQIRMLLEIRPDNLGFQIRFHGNFKYLLIQNLIFKKCTCMQAFSILPRQD